MNNLLTWFQDNKIIAALALSFLAFAEIVDSTILTVAIPQLMVSLDTNIDSIALVTTSYIIASGVFTLLTGWLIKRLGTKTLSIAAGAIFMFASILCGLSSSLPEIVVFRYLQGIGAGFLPAIAQVYIIQAFDKERRNLMLTLFGAILITGPVVGPILGSFLTGYLSWRFVFFVNVPVCIICIIVILRVMPKDEPQLENIDLTSFAFLLIGMSGLQYFIDQGSNKQWLQSTGMIVLLVSSILSLIFFVWRGFLGKSVINFYLFKNVNFLANNLVGFIFIFFSTAAITYFATMIQNINHYPVETVGWLLMPRGAAALLSAPLIFLLAKKMSGKLLSSIGFLGYGLCSLSMAHWAIMINPHVVLINMMLQGVSMMLFIVPMLQMNFVDIPEKDREEAGGIYNFVRSFALSLATSLSATYITKHYTIHYHDLIHNISPFHQGYLMWEQHLLTASAQIKAQVAQAQVSMQSFAIAFLDNYYLFGLLLVLFSWTPFLLKEAPAEERGQLEAF